MGRRKHIPKVGATLVAPSAPTLTAPSDEDWVTPGGQYTVSATYGGSDVIDRIDWVLDPGVDEIVVATDAAAAYSQTWTVGAVAGGDHTLVARAVRGASSTDSAAIDIHVLETPLDLADVIIWCPDQSITGVTDGTALTTWPDLSGNSNSPTQAVAGNKPLYRATGGSNSRAAVESDGTNDFLRKTFTWNQPAHIFLVAKFLTASANGDTIIDGAAANTIRLLNNLGAFAIYSGGAAIVGTVAVDTNWHVIELQFNGASSKIKIDANATDTGDAGTNNPAGIILALAGDQGSGPADCRYSEIIGLTAIQTTSAANALRKYLQLKFAL